MPAPTSIVPVLKWLGGKGTVADVISSVAVMAAQEKWGSRWSAPFDIWAEPGGGGLVVTCEVYNRVAFLTGDPLVGDVSSWRITDPAPGWAVFMRQVLDDQDLMSRCHEELVKFDALYPVRRTKEQQADKTKYSTAQVEAFATLRTELNGLIKLYLSGVQDPATCAELAWRYWLFNHRTMNGNMRVGSGRKRMSWDTVGRKERGVPAFTAPVGKYNTRGPPVDGGVVWQNLQPWWGRPNFHVSAATYAEELAALADLAKSGARVVAYIDPPFYRKDDGLSVTYTKTQAEQTAAAEAALRDARREEQGLPKRGGSRAVAPERVSTFAEWTKEGFPPQMWRDLRDQTAAFVHAGGVAIVSSHFSTGPEWEATDLFWSATGGDDADGVLGEPAPGQAHRGLRGGARKVTATTLEQFSYGGAGLSRRFIRTDWLGVAGLDHTGLTLPVRNWVVRAAKQKPGVLKGGVHYSWQMLRR